MPREIIHVQLGTYSNYLGTHFWNLEDELSRDFDPNVISEVDRSILYRIHEDAKGVVNQVPRLVTCDTKYELGALSPLGTLHPDLELQTDFTQMAPQTWNGKIQTRQEQRIDKSPFIQDIEAEDVEIYEKENEKLEEIPEARFNDDQVRFWSDYSKCHYHHKSIVPLTGR